MFRIIRNDMFLTSSETTFILEHKQCAPPQLLRGDCTVVAVGPVLDSNTQFLPETRIICNLKYRRPRLQTLDILGRFLNKLIINKRRKY